MKLSFDIIYKLEKSEKTLVKMKRISIKKTAFKGKFSLLKYHKLFVLNLKKLYKYPHLWKIIGGSLDCIRLVTYRRNKK